MSEKRHNGWDIPDRIAGDVHPSPKRLNFQAPNGSDLTIFTARGVVVFIQISNKGTRTHNLVVNVQKYHGAPRCSVYAIL